MRVAASLTPLAVAALLTGCGSSSSSGTSSSITAASTSSAPAATSSSGAAGSGSGSGSGSALSMTESEFKIVPASPSVTHTGVVTITVKNTGTVVHALSVQAPGGIISTPDIAPGGTATLKVNLPKAGRYVFFCPIPGHRAAGMQGVLTVGSPHASSGSGGAAVSAASSSKSGY